MVHVFMGEVRERYGLERLWRDASELPLASMLETAKPAKVKRPAARKPRATAAATKKKAAPKRRKKSAD
jgi:hypothetical protein